jgi:hypothetical protein
MKSGIGKFVAGIRRTLFELRVSREIYHRIFPHLNQEADHGYAFSSDDEIASSCSKSWLAAESTLRLIEQTAGRMPKAEGDAFRYIAYRDLNERMSMYLEFASQRVQPATCDPRFIATRAPV